MTHRLFCYYGDDFTGSTDALEALASNSISTVLFLDPPTNEILTRYPNCRAIGVAGESRSRDPQWMATNLPAIFERLKQLRAGLCHYKVCSTFDSSPTIGSIGRALEIGLDVFAAPWAPIVVAAPHLRRYVLFGNLFAAAANDIFRIDRHPTMSHHPSTPMEEGDLRLHLGRQMSGRIESLDILALRSNHPASHLERTLAEKPSAVLFDGLDAETHRATGQLLWQHRPAPYSFAVGSSGLIHALVEHWREIREIGAKSESSQVSEADRVVVVSGSCSPVTAGQIRYAAANGYLCLKLDVTTGDDSHIFQRALESLRRCQNIVIYTALGAVDQGIAGGERLGRRLGDLLRELLVSSGVRRAIIAGGDTSSHAVRQLGIESLTFAGLTSPGAPLCRCHAPGGELDGLELVLKGGQIGPENFFELVRRGKS